MATDATGTPTSLGIPTYNVDVDSPSGLGFNAAMGTINGLIDERVKPSVTPAVGDGLVWDGSDWVPTPAAASVTVSTWVGGPPASPGDGVEWIATGVDVGIDWRFRYDAANARWVFGGGTPVVLEVDAIDPNDDGSWHPTGVSFTPGRAGRFRAFNIVGRSRGASSPTGGVFELDVTLNGAAPALHPAAVAGTPSASQWVTIPGFPRDIDTTANTDSLTAMYEATSASTGTIVAVSMQVLPVYVSP